MRRLLQFATALLLLTTLAPTQAVKKPKPAPESVEWIWQYTPDDTNKDGRENAAGDGEEVERGVGEGLVLAVA